jgi:hypothetical protein
LNTRMKELRVKALKQGCGSVMISFGSDSADPDQTFMEVSSPYSGSFFESGHAGLGLERVARQTRTLFVKLRRYTVPYVVF